MKHSEALRVVASLLLEAETLDGDDIDRILAANPPTELEPEVQLLLSVMHVPARSRSL